MLKMLFDWLQGKCLQTVLKFSSSEADRLINNAYLCVCQINDAKQAAQDTKDKAKDLQKRINNTMDSFERDKTKTKELIQRVKDYLMGQ